MEARKLAGWFLIVLGLAEVFQAIYLRTTSGYEAGLLFAFVTSTLFVAGAVLLGVVKRTAPKS